MKKQTRSNAKKSSEADGSVLADFFHDELKDIYWAEKHLVKALPKMESSQYRRISFSYRRTPGSN